MNTFKVSIYAYPIGSDDWKLRHKFYFNAENLEMEKIDSEYFRVKVKASKLPLEHYQVDEHKFGCRKSECIKDYAHIEDDSFIFEKVQCVEFKGVWG